MFRLLHCPSTAATCLSRASSPAYLRASSFLAERSLSSDATASSSQTSAQGGVFGKIACLGTGKMASAVLTPMVRQGVQPAQDITIFDVNLGVAEKLASDHGFEMADNIPALVEDADLVILAVKPQNLTPAFWNELQKSHISEDAICLSIIAGKPIDCYRDGGFEKIVRSMPNTPATIGEGMTVWSSTPNLNKEERKKIRNILSCFGKSMYVDDESFIDMATSISGSGPAYIFMLMESMIDAGVHMGFPRDKATTLVYHTMLGSTLFAMETGEHPAILRNSVTSPSGTTASAIYELENGRFRTVIKDAMWACYRRSLEMGNHDSNVGPGRSKEIAHKVLLETADESDTDEEDNVKKVFIMKERVGQ
ncbi:hypothetical protein MPSEU_001009400 [Mayamaea pseudoterrestris]|nr:hypothetical protein MPSEU_001009400 [Mayamaea pseudoterrestris]